MSADKQKSILDIEDQEALCKLYDEWQGDPINKYTADEALAIMKALYKTRQYRKCLDLYAAYVKVDLPCARFNIYMGWSVYKLYFAPLKEAKFQADDWQNRKNTLYRRAEYVLRKVEMGTYSPAWKIVNSLTDALMQGKIYPTADFAEALAWLRVFAPDQLDATEGEILDQKGVYRKLASPREKWYYKVIKCLFQLQDYENCINMGKQALENSFINRFHSNHDCWIRYYMSKSYIALGSLQEAAAITQEVVRSFPNWNFYGLLCEIAIEQDQEKDFLKYAGYTALADNSHQMRIKIYAKIADYLHKCGRNREEMLHRKLIANLQLENNWSQKKIETVELPQDIADMSTKDVLKELKGFWQHWQDIGKVFQEGVIEKILPNGGSGFIRTDDNESYYFNFKDAKCNKQLLVPGNRMKFVLMDRMDRKKNTVKKNAVDIRLA